MLDKFDPSLFIRVGIATAAVFGVVGIASFVLPKQCDGSAANCRPTASAAIASSPAAGEASLEAAPLATATLNTKAISEPVPTAALEIATTPVPQASSIVPETAIPAPAEGVIAGTFDQLENARELATVAPEAEAAPSEVLVTASVGPSALPFSQLSSSPLPEQVLPYADTGSAEPQPGGPTTRVVRTVAVRGHTVATPSPEVAASVNGGKSWWKFAPVTVASLPATENIAPIPAIRSAALTKDAEAAATVATSTAKVGTRTVNVRSKASGSSSKLFSLRPGEEIQTAEIEKGWVRITDAKGRTGWVFSTFLQGFEQETAEAPARERKASAARTSEASSGGTGTRVVGGAGVNVRSGASKSSGKLFALTAGQKVTVSEDNKGWLRITDAKGRTGWVYKTFLSGS